MFQGLNAPNTGLGLEAIRNPHINQMTEQALNMHGFKLGNE